MICGRVEQVVERSRRGFSSRENRYAETARFPRDPRVQIRSRQPPGDLSRRAMMMFRRRSSRFRASFEHPPPRRYRIDGESRPLEGRFDEEFGVLERDRALESAIAKVLILPVNEASSNSASLLNSLFMKTPWESKRQSRKSASPPTVAEN